MNTFKMLLTIAIVVALIPAATFSQETARLQVIHNAADPAAEFVDVYVNENLLDALNDFKFRTATPFIDVPANTDLTIGVAPSTSSSAHDAIATFDINLMPGKKYIAVANGVLDPHSFAANPEGASTGFNIYIKEDAQEAAMMADMVEFAVMHGATDAPAVDVVARDVATLVEDAPYPAITDYIAVPPADYTIDIKDASGTVTVATFTAPLSGLTGGAAFVFASGFLTPSANQDGAGFGIFAALADGTVLELPAITTARLQVIHNAADPAAEMVDVYVNGGLLDVFNDFAFRAATPFLDVPANTNLSIAVAPPTSASVDEAIATFDVNLMAGKKYIAVANGVLDPSGFAANPEGASTGFNIYIKEDAQEAAMMADMVEFAVMHGATDAPAVDVVARDVATLVEDAPYPAITDYIAAPPADYILDIKDASGTVTVATFTAPLSGLTGGAAFVFASGFLTPSANQDGAGFGIFAALADGTVLELPAITTARLQVIHNAADPAAEVVDIYVNGGLLDVFNDFAFRAATPFLDVPANTNLSIAVAPPTSASVDEALATFDVNLMAGKKYIAVANGVLDPSSFADNPEGANTGFNIYIKEDAQEAAMMADMVEFAVMHGATDAPAVDVVARDVATLDEDAPYPAITDYIAVPPADYTIDIKDASGTVTVATFTAPLSGLTGGAAFVFASGFLTPSANQDGAGFGIFAALADGTVLELPAITTARLQVIHNAADPAAKMVDVYVNGALLDIFDDFEFRTATPFIDVPANTPITIGVAPGTSSSADDVIATFNATLMAGKTYVAVANGVLDPAKFEANPDGKDTGFTLLINDMARESGTSDDVDFFVVHGITDAPTVDVGVLNGPKILEGLAYGDISEYISVPAGYYEIDLRNSVTNSVVRWFEVELAGLGGGSAVVVASGFINNSGDQKGIGPVLLGVLADGTVVIFPDPPLTTDISDGSISAVPKEYDLDQNYPNPFNPSTEIQFSLPIRSFVSLKVYNMLGQEMANLVNQELSAGVHRVILDAANFESGVYFYRLEADGYKATRKMTLMK